ncbi:hypothetical protein WJT86_06045 [Microvirga sp. W0021]|uniref:Uncharacterized protein n=1 Tax=Hohaiivirga grylli TaxID=3133970 RepID=A0ABV0BIW4_9HYPH
MKSNRRIFWLSFFITALAVLFGWSATERADDLRICERSIVAINDGEAQIHVQRVTTTSFSRIIRIDYDAIYPQAKHTFSRYVTCRFSAEKSPFFKSDLSSVETEYGPVSETNLFMLKRFYLDKSDTASRAVTADQETTQFGFKSFMAHILEWILSVATKAAFLAGLAGLFLLVASLFTVVTPHAFYGISGAIAATLGALLTTGNQSPIALSLALTAGIINGGCAIILYARSLKSTESTFVSVSMPWLLLLTFIMMALFGFPSTGTMGPSWLPARLFSPMPLMTIGGYSISVPAFGLAMIIAMLAMTAFTLKKLDQVKTLIRSLHDNKARAFILFLIVLTAAGSLSAFSYVQFGIAFNPLLLGTKALLLAMIVGKIPSELRAINLVLGAIALISLEFALSPFFLAVWVDMAAYAVLILCLLMTSEKRKTVS